MSAFDLYAACNAMATALAAVTPPSGESAMRKAYGQAPNNTPSTPCAIVMPQEGSLTLGSSQYDGEHKVDVWFLIAKIEADFPRIEARRQKWLPALLHAFDAQMALGLAPVVRKAFPIGWEFDELVYGGVSYDGIKIHFEIDTNEIVSLAA